MFEILLVFYQNYSYLLMLADKLCFLMNSEYFLFIFDKTQENQNFSSVERK